MEAKEYTSNKLAIIQVLGALIKNPLLFADNNYSFSLKDFPEQFHQIVFGALEHLASQGMEKIDYIDVDQFLKQYPIQYKVFCDNNGIAYIQNCLKLFDEKKFDYYYKTLKKHSLINTLQSEGIDTKDIYDPNILDPKQVIKMQEQFDALSVDDILLKEELKILNAKEIFGSNSDRIENSIGDGLDDYIESLKETPVMGLPLMSPKLTTIYRGARRGCVYMMSSGPGFGKTRVMVGEACHLSIPEYYDTEKNEWVYTGLNEKVLLIETELELKEVQTMVVANVSGVQESHILDGRYTQDEEERIAKAKELIKNSNFKLVAITNYNTEDLLSVIKKYHQIYQCDYIFYDYLSENIKIMAETSSKTKTALRTDQILLAMITALKDTAKLLDIFIFTATQTSGDIKGAKELDASYLRSAKSLADKVDCASFLMPVREADQDALNTFCSKGFELVPNFVLSIYKVRRGSYQNIKLYIYFDRGICRFFDGFVVDSKGVFLPVADTNIEIILDSTTEEKFTSVYQSAAESADNDEFDFDF